MSPVACALERAQGLMKPSCVCMQGMLWQGRGCSCMQGGADCSCTWAMGQWPCMLAGDSLKPAPFSQSELITSAHLVARNLLRRGSMMSGPSSCWASFTAHRAAQPTRTQCRLHRCSHKGPGGSGASSRAHAHNLVGQHVVLPGSRSSSRPHEGSMGSKGTSAHCCLASMP